MENVGSPADHHRESRRSLTDCPIDQVLSELHIDDSDEDENNGAEPAVEPNFDSCQCLFCNHRSSSLDDSLEHMNKSHGLFIPDEDHLVVDLHTFVAYFHLVIFGYSECLYCGSQRRSPEAAQQHMMGKGHCKIDILDERSEFRDFYDFGSGPDSSDGDLDSEDEEEDESSQTAPRAKHPPIAFVQPDSTTLRLTSGRTLMHRSYGKVRPRQRRFPHGPPPASGASDRQPKVEDGSGPATAPSPGPSAAPAPISSAGPAAGALTTRSAKREAVFEKQLASVRAADRRSLAHLTVPQQRAVLAKATAQVERARKEENEMKLKIQLKANRAIKK